MGKTERLSTEPASGQLISRAIAECSYGGIPSRRGGVSNIHFSTEIFLKSSPPFSKNPCRAPWSGYSELHSDSKLGDFPADLPAPLRCPLFLSTCTHIPRFPMPRQSAPTPVPNCIFPSQSGPPAALPSSLHPGSTSDPDALLRHSHAPAVRNVRCEPFSHLVGTCR